MAICTCRRGWRNDECPIHSKPRCSMLHPEGQEPEGTWLVPPAEPDGLPMLVCHECADQFIKAEQPVQVGLW